MVVLGEQCCIETRFADVGNLRNVSKRFELMKRVFFTIFFEERFFDVFSFRDLSWARAEFFRLPNCGIRDCAALVLSPGASVTFCFSLCRL